MVQKRSYPSPYTPPLPSPPQKTLNPCSDFPAVSCMSLAVSRRVCLPSQTDSHLLQRHLNHAASTQELETRKPGPLVSKLLLLPNSPGFRTRWHGLRSEKAALGQPLTLTLGHLSGVLQ